MSKSQKILPITPEIEEAARAYCDQLKLTYKGESSRVGYGGIAKRDTKGVHIIILSGCEGSLKSRTLCATLKELAVSAPSLRKPRQASERKISHRRDRQDEANCHD